MSQMENACAGQKRQKNLRHGKWTAEENAYAQELINEFKAGQIDDLTEGVSLRHYLAQKLSCLPKRISKKFEGTNYNGKLRYENADFKRSPDEQQKRRAQVKFLEARFRMKNPDADTTGSLAKEQFAPTVEYHDFSPSVASASANQSDFTGTDILMGTATYGRFLTSPATNMPRIQAMDFAQAAPSVALNLLPKALELLRRYPGMHSSLPMSSGGLMGDAYNPRIPASADAFLISQRALLQHSATQALFLASLKRSYSDNSHNANKRIKLS